MGFSGIHIRVSRGIYQRQPINSRYGRDYVLEPFVGDNVKIGNRFGVAGVGN